MDFRDNEALLTTCRSSQAFSANLWDPLTGSTLHSFRNGGVVAPKTLNLVGRDYLFTCDEDKPMTHVWLLNSQEPDKKLTTILSEKVTAMALCPHDEYLAAGIGVRLYVWHLCSGKLMTITKRNFQPITCVRFSSDGHFVVVAGQDGMLVVYKLANLVSLHSNLASQTEGQVQPLYTKQDHSLPITDLHVGSFGLQGRIVTVSADSTCKLYSLSSGTLLLNLVFTEALTSVIFDNSGWNLFVGRTSGKVQQFLLREPPRTVTHYPSDEMVFQGHHKRVTCLDLGLTSATLISGSEDCFVFIWEISSRQILRRIEHKGAVTNVRCLWRFENFSAQSYKVRTVVRNLDRDLVQSEDFVVGKIQLSDGECSDDETEERVDRGAKQVEEENARLRAANKQLYLVALKMSRKNNGV